MSFIIGLTGKSGSGKSTIRSKIMKLFLQNCIEIDIDQISRDVLVQSEEIINYIKCKVGDYIFDESGNVDRKKLGNIFFENRHNLKELSNLSWIEIQKSLNQILENNEHKIIILDWILLPHSGKYWDMCNVKVLVDANSTTRKANVISRDNISDDYFEKREKASIEYDLDSFDLILYNDYSCDKLSKNISTLYATIKSKMEEKQL